MAWTEEMDRICREGAALCKSAATIAKEIGGGLTRNAVIGYAHRKGIDISKGNRKRPVYDPKTSSMTLFVKPPILPHRERAHINFALLEAPKPLNILTLEGHVCHWPLWQHEGRTPIMGMLFCGAATNGASYCETHHMLAIPEARDSRSGLNPYRS